jgi:hypothetical protein
MRPGLYEKIVDEISLHPASTLRVHSVGEPLDWEGIAQALRYSHDKGVRSWLFTCGITQDRRLLDAVCAHTDIVEVSVNSSTKEDYVATKGVDAFGRVVENIRHMHSLKNADRPFRLIVSRVESSDRRADAEFVRYWKATNLVDDAFVRTYHTYNDLLPGMPEGQEVGRHEPCLVHWARFNVSVGGYAVVCFNELFKEQLDPALVYGDLNTQSIAEIWHGRKLTAIRRAELTGDYSVLPCADVLPCRECLSCQPLFGNRQTSEHQIGQIR